jgi:ferric-dicitrate binding protein FerR (iron transport regulator)
VLGTRFAVNTFRGVTRTVLEEGKVNISNAGSSASYELAPGELAQFKSNDNKIAVKKVNTRIYTSWTEDKLIFENTPMTEVVTRIEDTFGIEVILVDKAFSDETLSGSIKSTNLNVLEEALEEILKTHISMRDEKMFIGIDRDEK